MYTVILLFWVPYGVGNVLVYNECFFFLTSTFTGSKSEPKVLCSNFLDRKLATDGTLLQASLFIYLFTR